MTGRERILAAMNLEQPDRVPVMCQLSMGHYLVNLGLDPAEYLISNEVITDAYLQLADRYHFDGILINLPGRDPEARRYIANIEDTSSGKIVHYKNGTACSCPNDDLANQLDEIRVDIDDLGPELVFYEDPHTLGGLKNPPFYYDLEPYQWSGNDLFPDHQFIIIESVIAAVGDRLSVHAEVFSPFTQLMERLGYENGLMALLMNKDKCHALLQRYAEGASALARLQAARGVDAVLISSAFAGGGFISRAMYEEFVLPYEKQVASAIKAAGVKAYTHTCGAIGDRLDLMQASGIDGVDTMDPPPLGNTELAEAKKQIGDSMFLKGNVDSVNILLNGTVDQVRANAREKLDAAMAGGGYILSSACSVAPKVPAANILALHETVMEYGIY